MSKYYLNKFLFTIDRDPELVERYRNDPKGTVAWWLTEIGPTNLGLASFERTTWLTLEPDEREALEIHDKVALFAMGAHPFLTLTLWIALFERDFEEPLGMQLDYAKALEHFKLPYPDITT
ncbi:MAG: hypothetical protein M0Z45_00380 [Actinomycetota bacterium]|nr:hypothetical protein [Actinomycetota bacterium]